LGFEDFATAFAAKSTNAVGKSKQRQQTPYRFKVGTHGGCEASLFEFRERSLSEPHVCALHLYNGNAALLTESF
jgi:hypothetical protein